MDQNPLVEQRKEELLGYVKDFYQKSWNWRSTEFHEKWDKFDRNYHSIYDPEKASRKKPWQSRMFVDITLQNVEVIASQVYKTMAAPKPMIKTEPGPAGDSLQARLIQDVVDYEFDQASFTVAFHDVDKESIRYGSGFMKLFWEKVVDTRRRRVPVSQTPSEVVDTAPVEALAGAVPMPDPAIKSFQMANVPVLLRDCLAAKWVHIRDIFPEPNTTTWEKVIHRDKIAYGEIVRHIQNGEWFDVQDKLDEVTEGEKFESDISQIKQERGYFETRRQVAKYEKKHTIWELYAPIPRKWIQFDIPDGYEAEELVPAKVMVASGTALLSSEENLDFDGVPPILKDDYIRTGETYGKGICEMLLDDQDEINEHTNLGIDNMNILMNKMMVVLEDALVNIEQDAVSQPGGMIRVRSQKADDVRKAVMPLEFPDLANSYFKHRFDIERLVQEKTGANRVTLGSSGMVKDTNQTLGGMELLRQMFNERVAAYGMVKEDAFLKKVAHKVYGLIYQRFGEDPNGLKPILGEDPVEIGMIPGPMGPQPMMVPRYLAFAFVPPEEVYRSYRFKPQGIFSMENKVIKAAQVMDLIRLYAMNPGFDAIAAGKWVAVELQQISEAEKWFRDIPMIPMPIGMPGAPGMPGLPPPQGEKPGMKGGPNGNQPSFLPPNPLRREPVTG